VKRRQFLVGSAGLVGSSALPSAAAELARPCPPSQLQIQDGSSVNSTCASVDAESDWRARTAAPGVVWFHDFRNAAEVDNFRWRGGQGDDPGNTGDGSVRRVTTDGITGGACIEIHTAANTEAQCSWWRPLSPLRGAGNGRLQDDPGAGGAIAPQTFSPNSNYGGSNINSWGSRGLYGHSSYHSEPGFDGSEYYLQMRVKISESRFTAGNPSAGKLAYFTHTYRSLTSQEVVTQNNINRDFMAYRSGSPPLEPSKQFGSELSGYWKWPSDEWVTVLYHVVPGRNRVAETVFRVWVARSGVTSYTKIWDTNVVPLEYDYDNGQNALILSSYMNGVGSPTAWYVRFDQLIFSRAPIACPQV
jgi:hypothetical protein